MNQLEQELRSLLEKKKMSKVLLTNLLAVAFISTVDESINSRYSRSKKLRRIAGWSWINEEDQLERKLSADEAKRERRSDVVLRFSRSISADDVIGDVIIFSRCFERPVARISSRRSYSRSSRNAKISSRNVLSIQSQEDSGEAFGQPDASNSSIQSHTAAAVVHLWSLGVLTAAGCGIGSVHAVVRSNLLVEPSEVEEGEMHSAKEKINQTLHEEKMKLLVRKDVNNSGVESAVEEVNEPDVVVQLLTYQMLINRGESAVEQRTAVEQFAGFSSGVFRMFLLHTRSISDALFYVQEPELPLRGILRGQICLRGSPAVLTVSVVKKRCISGSAKQKMQSAIASIHQLQEISCCKQKSRPAVDTTDGSAGVAGPAGVQRTISWKQMRAVSCKQMSTRSNAKEESESDVEQLIQMLD
ncbi:hypothetical protein F511_31756 [Dorcoceras hygrometricum]|uniref:Uncharacterized protein n=1 Tax=Dorcoceras hygrometricum TaxID=472368 RepID=A0A2Z7A6I1_9LAMI|nr:hypothetical protein F511_31756 [Dorcoceras hygrometricum]